MTEIEPVGPDGLVRILSYEDTARGSRFLSWGAGEKTPGTESVLWSVPVRNCHATLLTFPTRSPTASHGAMTHP
ncbi:hypothetical protein [Streptomyces tibetensis]|uniref:hypothetical protein n=1 Tax=Streptomyces tibetensis TaxID=2382123 RepID=UPI00340D29BE